MTKEELRKKLQELSKNLSSIQEEVEGIPDTAISEIDELINGSPKYSYNPSEGIDAELQEIIDGLDSLANEVFEDDKKEAE